MERKAISVRLPADMHDWLAEQARAEHRSLNGQIVALLERAVVDDRTGQTERAAGIERTGRSERTDEDEGTVERE